MAMAMATAAIKRWRPVLVLVRAAMGAGAGAHADKLRRVEGVDQAQVGACRLQRPARACLVVQPAAAWHSTRTRAAFC